MTILFSILHAEEVFCCQMDLITFSPCAHLERPVQMLSPTQNTSGWKLA